MATRSIIARSHGDGFRGVYHHWDGDISGVGAALYNLYQGHFNKDIKAMMHFLIDEHPAGWSNIVDADFTRTPGFTRDGYARSNDEMGPQCYCHGDREIGADIITYPGDEQLRGAEYVYVINERTHKMYVHTAGYSTISGHYVEIDLDGPEPIWSLLESDLTGEDED